MVTFSYRISTSLYYIESCRYRTNSHMFYKNKFRRSLKTITNTKIVRFLTISLSKNKFWLKTSVLITTKRQRNSRAKEAQWIRNATRFARQNRSEHGARNSVHPSLVAKRLATFDYEWNSTGVRGCRPGYAYRLASGSVLCTHFE